MMENKRLKEGKMIQRYGQDTEFDMTSVIRRENGPYVLYADHLATLEAAVKEKDSTPDFARGFHAGRQSVLRTNMSGCCCKWDDKDEGEIVSLCEAHKEYIQEQITALNNRLKNALEYIDELKGNNGEIPQDALKAGKEANHGPE